MKYIDIEITGGKSGVCVRATPPPNKPERSRGDPELHYFSSIHEAAHWIVEAFSEPREPVTNPEKKET